MTNCMIRALRNVFTSHLTTSKIFNKKAQFRIKNAIKASELGHSGQIRLVVESALPWTYIFKGLSPRTRAIDLFSRLGVWDTEHNNGVLIYLLISEKVIEIVADRGLSGRISMDFWSEICKLLSEKFKDSDFEEGVLEAISQVNTALRKEYPNSGFSVNELPDNPVII